MKQQIHFTSRPSHPVVTASGLTKDSDIAGLDHDEIVEAKLGYQDGERRTQRDSDPMWLDDQSRQDNSDLKPDDLHEMLRAGERSYEPEFGDAPSIHGAEYLASLGWKSKSDSGTKLRNRLWLASLKVSK